MKLRVILSQALTAIATIVLIVEIGEFLLFSYVWVFTTGSKEASSFDGLVVVGTSVVTIATLLACVASFALIEMGRSWPTGRIFVGTGLVAASIQATFFALGSFNFGGDWVGDFFDSKRTSFAAGAIAVLVLIAVGVFVRRRPRTLSER